MDRVDRGAAAFLLVEDDERLRNTLRRLLAPFGGVALSSTAADAMAALAASAFTGLLIDVNLPDGSGVEVLAYARRHCAQTAYAALVSGDVTPAVVAEAFRFDAQYLVKPFSLDEVYEFARRAQSRAAKDAALEEHIEQWAKMYSLTGTERQILVAAAMGKERQGLVDDRHIAPATLKQHIRNLLAKPGDRTLAAAAIRLLRKG